MTSSREHRFHPNLKSWFSGSIWRERIITFDPSWFTVCMGTGVITQLLDGFPWPSHWLRNLGYAFWILNVALFGFFTVMGILRLFLYPRISKSIFDDLAQTSFLGAIPVALDTLVTGIALYYNRDVRAMYTAEALYWIAVAMTVAVGCGGVFAMYRHQGQHKLEDVNGVLLISFIPMIVTAALGSSLSPYLIGNNTSTILVVSFLMLSLGVGLSLIITTIYFWRLMACSLPPRDAIVSCFVPVGPVSMGAFAVLGLSLDLSRFITVQQFVFEESWNVQIDTAGHAVIGQMIIWIGVIFALALLGIGTFFLIQAFASVFSSVPKQFNIGFWAFVFPCGVYANAFCRLGATLRNDGMKGWAAACVVVTVLLWLMCAAMTTYKGVWQGKTFVSPGLHGYVEQEYIDQLRNRLQSSDSDTIVNGEPPEKPSTHDGNRSRAVDVDGTYRRINPPRVNGETRSNDDSV